MRNQSSSLAFQASKRLQLALPVTPENAQTVTRGPVCFAPSNRAQPGPPQRSLPDAFQACCSNTGQAGNGNILIQGAGVAAILPGLLNQVNTMFVFFRNILRSNSLLQSPNIMVMGPVFYALLRPSLLSPASFLLNGIFVLVSQGRDLEACRSDFLSVF